MKSKEEIVEILRTHLNSVYCDTCEGEKREYIQDACEDCPQENDELGNIKQFCRNVGKQDFRIGITGKEV